MANPFGVAGQLAVIQASKRAVSRVLMHLGLRSTPRCDAIATGSLEEIERVYSEVFDQERDYDVLDESNRPKLAYVGRYADTVDGPLLDAGCGRGNVLRFLHERGCQVFGIELSTICYEKYLRDLPAANVDILSWANGGSTYAGCVCTDVLEHIPIDQVDGTIGALRRMSPSLFAGVANHSSIHAGRELHVIREGIGWWVRRLGLHYPEVTVIVPDRSDDVLWKHFQNEVFFFLRCSVSQIEFSRTR